MKFEICKYCGEKVNVSTKNGILNHYKKVHENELTVEDTYNVYMAFKKSDKLSFLNKEQLIYYFENIIKDHNRKRYDNQLISHARLVKILHDEFTMDDIKRFFSHVLPLKLAQPGLGNSKELCYRVFENKEEAEVLYKKEMLAKNPYYQHGSELSPYSTKHKRYAMLSEEERVNAVSNFAKNVVKNITPDNSPLHIEYYIKRGMSEAEAKEALKNRQSTFSLEKCIEKYGEEEGNKRWLERQEKWLENYKKLNYSKVSQKLFWDIFEVFENDADNIYFATLDKNKQRDDSGKNYEYLFRSGKRHLKLDFFLKNKKKVIEFDGYYWHRAHAKRITNEEKDALLKEAGYDVYHVNEMDYYDDPTEVLKNCIKFLNT